MGDLLSDMVARIRNAQVRRKLSVDVVNSKICRLVLECLLEEGFIRGYTFKGNYIMVHLKYKGGYPVLKECTRISRPGLRKYMSYKALKRRFEENELVVFTSSKGVFLNSALVIKGMEEGGEALLKIS
jgi:small subunit ribosomal protein S8